MSQLKALIDQLTAFGTHPNIQLPNKTATLKQLLVDLYAQFLHLEFELDETPYPQGPTVPYKEILANVQSNFPDFGWYSTILDTSKLEPNIALGIGDELDDLTDIITSNHSKLFIANSCFFLRYSSSKKLALAR